MNPEIIKYVLIYELVKLSASFHGPLTQMKLTVKLSKNISLGLLTLLMIVI